jgi:SAM-dependent methyltransferase
MSDQTTYAGQCYQSPDVVEGWRKGAAQRAATWGPATEMMLDLAGIQVGSRVLDVGAGAGDQTLLAARRVGPEGHILATDISPIMLEVAAELAGEAGLANVETRVMNARQLDLPSDSFDAAISRLLIMLVPEPHEVVADIRRVLKPGARFAAIVFSTPERNPVLSIPLAIAARHGGLPEPTPDTPGTFGLAAPGRLEQTLQRGGLHAVEVHTVPTIRRAASPAQVVTEQRSSFPRLIDSINSLPETEREPTWQAIEQALAQFAGPHGVEIPGEFLIGVGTA